MDGGVIRQFFWEQGGIGRRGFFFFFLKGSRTTVSSDEFLDPNGLSLIISEQLVV